MSELNSTTKVCSQCHIEKPVYEFHKHSREKDGYRRNCKQCRADNGECNYVKPAPPGFKWCRKCNTLYPATTDYFYNNKTRNGLYASCKSCHYLTTRDWQKRNREYWNGLNHNWMLMHPDKMKISRDNWLKTKIGKDTIKRLRVSYRKRHPEKVKARSKKGKAKRRMVEANAEGNHTTQDIIELFNEQNGQCAYCGIRLFWEIKGDIHLEHIIPLSRGGTNWPDNLCLSCKNCNEEKSTKTAIEWQAVRGW